MPRLLRSCTRHPLDLLMTRLKFGRSLAAGRVLSELWIDAIAATAPALPTLFVPVPLHASRLRERGYNQALELLRPLARSLRIPLAESLLARTRATPAQANLDAVARRQNLRGAFEFHAPALRGIAPGAAHVALVDDVMTTGATLRECARVLRARRHRPRRRLGARARAAATLKYAGVRCASSIGTSCSPPRAGVRGRRNVPSLICPSFGAMVV